MKLTNLENYGEEINLEEKPEYLDLFTANKTVGRYMVNSIAFEQAFLKQLCSRKLSQKTSIA